MENRKYRISATEKSYERLIKGFTWEKVADKIELEFSDEIRYYTDKVDVSLTKYRDSKLKFTF